MSKRFRDTEIWRKEWYRKLTPEQKCAWNYLCDECDNVGVLSLDREAAAFVIGGKVDWEALVASCNGNIEVLSDGKLWLVDFCLFQHGDLFGRKSSAALDSYMRLLDKHGLTERVRQRFGYSCQTVQGKGKGIGKGMGEGKGREEGESERGKRAPVADVVQYLNAKTGRDFKVASANTAAHIRARFREGFQFCDFKAVIDAKVKEWGGDPKMAPYLRPETLFGTKFDSYLQVSKTRIVHASKAKNPSCDVCGKECAKEFGYWSCVEHGRRENVG